MNNLCPSCGAGYNVTPQHVGRQLACKKCGAMLTVKPDGLHLAEAEPIHEPFPSEPPEEDYASERAFRRPPRSSRSIRYDDQSGAAVMDFLAFRRMIVPIIIQILFWLGVVAALVGGVVLIAGGNAEQIVLGIFSILLGPLVVRIYCELLIVVFRINETLTDVRNDLRALKK